MSGPTPLSPSVSFALWNDRLFVGETLIPAFQVVDGDGMVVSEIPWEPEQLSPREALDEVVRLAIQNADPERQQEVRDRLDPAPVPDRVPLHSAFMVDPEGFIWVRPFEVGRDAAALGGPLYGAKPAGGLWWVLTLDGELVGSIECLPDLKIHQITADAVVGIRQDSLGVESVHVHGLVRR
jgi:hypothetical protein